MDGLVAMAALDRYKRFVKKLRKISQIIVKMAFAATSTICQNVLNKRLRSIVKKGNWKEKKN